ncbi:MAG: hypothetical protein C5B50_11615 [Verrucomicrobia bacterium]|nr:MAG: hypothetical protein C5B50_11615 [Verrucomicrobiota bacterium]
MSGSLMFVPGHFARRSDFYHQLGQLTSAGLGVVNALQQLQRTPPARSYRKPIQSALEHLDAGCTLSESCRQVRGWLPDFDIALLQVGEQSGRLDGAFRSLTEYYNDRAQLARLLILGLLYPACLFHFAVFILPLAQFVISGNWRAYLLQTFGILLPIYAVLAFVVYASQSSHGERWRAALEKILSPVPVLGNARRCLALSRLAGALDALLAAGVTVIEAWELAAVASGSPALRRTVLAWRPLVDAGQTPGETLSSSNRFPEIFANQYITGEISGKLEESLRRLQQHYRDEGFRKLRVVTWSFLILIYSAVVVMIAFKVILFWTNYFKQIGAAAGF